MSRIEVRDAVPDDIEAIQELAERGWQTTYASFLADETIDVAMNEWYDAESIREAMDQEDVACFVAEANEEVMGYLNGGPGDSDDVAILSDIYVDPDRRGEGIGTTLLHTFETFCDSRGYAKITFHVFAENEVGVSFYQTHGYETVYEHVNELFGEEVREYTVVGPVQ